MRPRWDWPPEWVERAAPVELARHGRVRGSVGVPRVGRGPRVDEQRASREGADGWRGARDLVMPDGRGSHA